MRSFPADHISACFPIRTRTGDIIGHVEEITHRGTHLTISGWTRADEVGVRGGPSLLSQRPDIPRPGIGATLDTGPAEGEPQGFRLEQDIPGSPLFFFARQGQDVYYYQL